ncbi:MAG TPA: amino acid adenylation domain-containing protein, partial [Magnetospirillaceae bacterium]|nr:amino acid adenylation domain-containing protein [Magnetospirillaceae bacterium]
PSDVKRSSTIEYQPACTASVSLPVSRLARREELLGALAALLQRYTAQEAITFDVFDGIAELPIALEFALHEDSPITALNDHARLETLAAVPILPEAASNIAATVVLDPAAGLSVNGAYDAHFILVPAPDAVSLTLGYNAALLKPATANQLMESYGVLLAAALDDPASSVQSLPILSPQTAYALSVLQDGGTASYPGLPVHGLFSALARTQPNATVASYREHSLSYHELDELSNQLAHHLLAWGVGPEMAVAVCLRPSLEVLVAMLAIWKARGVYLPLDPTHPGALIGRMLDEAKPKVVLTTTDLVELTAAWPQLCFDRDADLYRGLPRTAPATEPSLDDTAYLLYTSGTTGKSKGVAATQRNLVQYILSAAQKYGFTGQDCFVSLARYTFSISLWELVSPLCCGGHLRLLDREDVLSPERLARFLRDVSVLHAGPSLLGGLFRHLRTLPQGQRFFPRMRHASSGGDMVTPAVMEEMKGVFPHAELFVIYGCSEVSCMGTTYPIEREAAQSRTFVGKPFPNVTLRVLDQQRNLVPFGVVGEICFAGDGIVRGYLDRPDLTEEKFVEIDGKRFYRTGDMGRLHSDGHLEFLGRRDFQIQLRGIRIELAGIETVVQQLGLASQCAVIARPSADGQGTGDARLVAFVVKPRNDRIATFRRALAKELPDYMLPHQVVVLDAMPLTVNGKLDRNRLAEMPVPQQQGSNGPYAAPLSERERKVAEIMARTLGLREVGAEDSFFDLGGDSLLGMIALMEIDKELGVALPPSILFESGTVRALAAWHPGDIASVNDGLPRPVLLNHLLPGTTPLYLLSGVHAYRELAKRLDGHCTAYGVFTRRELEAFDPECDFQSVESLAQDYIRIIRAQQPNGPYRILGYSFSGIVAYEVAHQLRAAGETVEFLALIDSHLPEWNAGWKHRLAMLSRLPRAPWRQSTAFLWQKLRQALGAASEEPQVYYDDHELGEWEVQRGVANYNTIAQYRPRIRPTNLKMLLLVSAPRLRENPLHSPSCGWRPFARKLQVHYINADHFQMMRDDPYVTQSAAIIAERLKAL